MPRAPKRVVYEVQHDSKQANWKGIVEGSTRAVVRAPTKEQAVKQTIAKAKARPEPTSVRIKKEDGTVQEERTYPRRSDPYPPPG